MTSPPEHSFPRSDFLNVVAGQYCVVSLVLFFPLSRSWNLSCYLGRFSLVAPASLSDRRFPFLTTPTAPSNGYTF